MCYGANTCGQENIFSNAKPAQSRIPDTSLASQSGYLEQNVALKNLRGQLFTAAKATQNNNL